MNAEERADTYRKLRELAVEESTTLYEGDVWIYRENDLIAVMEMFEAELKANRESALREAAGANCYWCSGDAHWNDMPHKSANDEWLHYPRTDNKLARQVCKSGKVWELMEVE